VEKRVEILLKDKEGALKIEPFTPLTRANGNLITRGEDEGEEETDDSSEEE